MIKIHKILGNENTADYSASKTSTSTNSTNNTDVSTNDDVVVIDKPDNTNTETDIASFSTKIYTPNDSARMNNLQITCSKLNGTIVKPR